MTGATSRTGRDFADVPPDELPARLDAAERELAGLAAPPDDGAPDGPTLALRSAADVETQPVAWYWGHRIPRGKVADLSGYPGDGKSHVLTALVADDTNGRPMPGEAAPRDPGRVLWFSLEEDPADTVVPRLLAAGACLERVTLLEGVTTSTGDVRAFTTDDAALLTAHCAAEAAAGRPYSALVVDPLNLLLPAGTKTHNDHDVRHALQPLARIAERFRLAALVVRHFKKGAESRGMLRAGGSIGFAAAARAMYSVATLEDGGRALVCTKLSNAAPPKPRAFRIEGCEVRAPAGQVLESSRLVWGEELEADADDLLAAADEKAEPGEDRDDVDGWLRTVLEAGAVPVKDMQRIASAEGYAWRTVQRRATALGVRKERHGIGVAHASVWSLPAPTRATEPPLVPLMPALALGTSGTSGTSSPDVLAFGGEDAA